MVLFVLLGDGTAASRTLMCQLYGNYCANRNKHRISPNSSMFLEARILETRTTCSTQPPPAQSLRSSMLLSAPKKRSDRHPNRVDELDRFHQVRRTQIGFVQNFTIDTFPAARFIRCIADVLVTMSAIGAPV